MRMRDLDGCNSEDRSSGASIELLLLIPSRVGRRNVVGDVGVDRVKLTLLLSGSCSST